MIIKQADDKAEDIRVLEALLTHPDAKPDIKRKIEQKIGSMRSGAKGEKDAAYQIDFDHGPTKNWAVIHDLRLEHQGRVAQIDHLIIDRLLDIWVCESKRFQEGIVINEHGEFAALLKGKPVGVPSPIEQNRRHRAVLQAMFDDGVVKLPRRLGFAIKPDIKSLILISTNALIQRPKVKVEGLDEILKVDQLRMRVEKDFDENNLLNVAKVISSDTLEDFARRLVALHRPASFDWHASFGLAKPIAQPAVAEEPAAMAWHARMTSRPAPKPTLAPPAEAPAPSPQAEGNKKSKLVCCACDKTVSYSVAKFCWFNKPRFGGKVYCMDCQKTVSVPA